MHAGAKARREVTSSLAQRRRERREGAVRRVLVFLPRFVPRLPVSPVNALLPGVRT